MLSIIIILIAVLLGGYLAFSKRLAGSSNWQARIQKRRSASRSCGLALQAVADNSTESIIAESADLIFTDSSLAHLQTLQDRGLKVQILTNSLAANKHTTAFVGYRKQRKEQIAAMSELYEYRPDATTQTSMYQELTPGQTAPHFGLPTKTSVYDLKTVFIGSFNLGPHSENLDIEIGFLVESEALANAVADSNVGDMGPGNAWQVRLNDDGDTERVTIQDGEETIEPDSEPLSSGGRNLEADLARPFTPEAQM